MMTEVPLNVFAANLKPYAGRWVAFVRGQLVGVGLTLEEARVAAQHMRAKDVPKVQYVPEPSPPGLFEVSRWPLVQAAVAVLERNQMEGLLVGGAVRDLCLGRPVHDWDFVVARDAMRLARQTADRLGAAYYTLDAERDTGRVVVQTDAGSRIFLDFSQRRGADWTTDLITRDFTVNALALSLYPPGLLFDPLGGRADLAARRLRATSEYAFRDDPARLLRGVRVAAALGFTLEAQTLAWMQRDAALLPHISAERIRDELVKVLALPGAAAAVRLLDELDLLAHVVPESVAMKSIDQSHPHHWNVFEHTLLMLDMLEQIVGGLYDQPPKSDLPVPAYVWSDVAQTLGSFRSDLVAHIETPLSDERTVWDALKLAALLHDCGKPATLTVEADGRTRFFDHDQVGAELAGARAHRLRLANIEVERVRTIVANHMRPQQLAEAGLTARGAYRYFRATGPAGVDIILLALADHLATHGPDVQSARWHKRLQTAAELLTNYFGRLRANLGAPALVNGGELIKALGLTPGPRVGELLEVIREAQMAGEIDTKPAALNLARAYLAASRED